MTNIFSKVASAVSAFALFAAIAPASVLAQGSTYVIAAPSTHTIQKSALLSAGDLDAAVAAGLTPITIGLNSVAPEGDEQAMIRINPTQGTNGHVQIWTKAPAPDNGWYDVAQVGYGPGSGFPIGPVYSDSLNVYVVSDVAGTYNLQHSVQVVSGQGTVSSATTVLTVEEPTSATVNSEAELNAALANANIVAITFGGSFTVNSTITVNRTVNIDGAGKTLTAGAGVTGTGLLITAPNVTVTDLTVDAAGRPIQAIQAYTVAGITLDGVTAKNAGKSGIMVNGSTVTVRDVTTSGNTWHGINVDQGSGVTTAAILTVEGTSTHSESGPDIYIDNDAKGSVTGSTAQYALVKPTLTSSAYFINSATVSNEAELTAALADANVATITLDDSFEVSATVQVNRPVTIDGSGETITAGGPISHVILITASNVSIKDLTVDGDNNMLHGIQAYVVTGITLDNITSINNGKSGILVNGSTVTVTDVTTSGNGWHAINVDQGSGVTTVAALTIGGTNTHAETVPAIWVDNIAKNVSVTDTDAKYTGTDVTYVSGAVNVTGRQYFLTPDPVVEEDDDDNNGGSGRSGSSRRTVNTNSNANTNASVTGQVNSVTPGQGQVLGASTYNFTVNLSYGSTGADVNVLQQMLIDAGLLKIAAPTGWFGPMTKAALAQWQAAHGVAPAVGFFGPITRAAIAAMAAPTTSTTTPSN